MVMSHLLRILFVFCSIAVFIAGCSTMWQASSGTSRGGVSSSLVDYLYPDGEEPPPYSEAVPQLNIPLRVGLAFVPATRSTEYPVLSEATKTELLGRVRQQFLDREYISEIEVIPGFAGLQFGGNDDSVASELTTKVEYVINVI